jgi:hypothetical protein|tara:strand:- start:133 stop:336 length:204 start_codon:yes stop_codon:yes gene_type:complete
MKLSHLEDFPREKGGSGSSTPRSGSRTPLKVESSEDPPNEIRLPNAVSSSGRHAVDIQSSTVADASV